MTFKPNPATRTRSPTIFTQHAIATKISGDLESPSPLNTEEIVLYAVINKNPVPQIRTYCTVKSNASSGACIKTESCGAKTIKTTLTTTEIIENKAIVAPSSLPILSSFFIPMYLEICTVTAIANPATTNVARFIILLPVEIPLNPDVVPN